MSLTKTVTVKSPQSSLWGVTAFFNPQHYRRRKMLYRVFRERSKQQGLRLLTVELAFNDAPFELHRREAEILIQLRCGENSVMWQKERLLNIGLNHLPPECTSLVWLDCDVVFGCRIERTPLTSATLRIKRSKGCRVPGTATHTPARSSIAC
jgi:hypothetical protein